MLDLVQLGEYGSRRPAQLSGGQQQRVALARALVAEPKVILFDEPLSNLDAKLREETRKELRTFLSGLKITAVYVTHDRVEALALSDRIAVMRSGRIVEEGDPKKIYFRSDSRFVADFIGRANLIPGKVAVLEGEHAAIDTGIGRIVALNPQKIAPGADALACVRPEFIRVAGAGAADRGNIFRGKIETLLFVGEAYEGEIRIGDTRITTSIPPTVEVAEGGDVSIAFDPDHCFLLPA
jgi:iron(III) transport system ATP-binding protein